MSQYPAPEPHGPIEEVFADVFFVQGSIRIAPGMRINRGMVILRHGTELTLVNPVRLDAAGQSDLERLGQVKRAVRLGHQHGRDDPYVVAELGASYWTLEQETLGPTVRRQTMSATRPPCPDTRLFEFQDTVAPEGALLVESHRLLITCDAVQHWEGTDRCSLLARLTMPLLGFRQGTLIGPPWRRDNTQKGGPTLEADFRRLLELDFDHLVGAHGRPRIGGAKEALRAHVDRIYS